MKKFLYYFFKELNEFTSITFNIDFRKLQIIRGIIGGVWYKQTMSGELPNCYGSWWTQSPLKPHIYHFTEKIENYTANKVKY
jgi:hypothetical protein